MAADDECECEECGGTGMMSEVDELDVCYGEIRRLTAALAAAEERARQLRAINVDHCNAVNTLLVEGARLQERAEKAEAALANALRRYEDALASSSHDRLIRQTECKAE